MARHKPNPESKPEKKSNKKKPCRQGGRVRRALGSILEVTSRERRDLAIALRDGGELIGIWATN